MSECRKRSYHRYLDARIAMALTARKGNRRVYWCASHCAYHLTSTVRDKKPGR